MIYMKIPLKNGKEANDFFGRLNEEIEKAFQEKKLEKERTTFSIFINATSLKNLLTDFPKSILNAIIYSSTYQNIRTASRENIFNKKTGVYPMNDIIGIMYEDYRYAENMITDNIWYFEMIRIIYKYFTMIFSIISLIIYIKNIKKKDSLNTINHLVFLSYWMILLGVSYTDATAFHAIRYRYLAGVYILQNIFILLNLYRYMDNHKIMNETIKEAVIQKGEHPMKNISIVIPAYNEEKVIGKTIDEIQKVLKKNKITRTEIIIVNDGSTDDTRKKALAKNVKVLDNPENMGYGYSLKKGITAAKYETIIITDADNTYPFDNIVEMLEKKNSGYDLVVGARNGKYYKESIHKMILRKILKRLVEFVTERKVKDINSGLRIFDKSTVMKFFPRLCNTFSFSTSQTLAYMMNSLSVCYVDINYQKRVGKSKVRLIRDSFKSLRYIMEACIYYNPMKMFSLLSIICIMLSIIGFIFSHFVGIHAGYILGIGGLLLSIVIFSIGLLAVLLKQIMDK